MKHKKAIKILTEEFIRLGGSVFARYLATKNEESLKSIEAAEFLEDMLTGNLKLKDREYLEKYLKPMWEINDAINILGRDK